MFQYTSENIINSNVGNINSHRFAVLEAGGTEVTTTGNNTNSGKNFIVDGVTNIAVADIKHIYRTPYAAAVKAEATITVPTITANKVVRLRINLTEQGRSSSIMQNAYLHKNKPFTYEIIATGTAATDAENIEKAIKRELAETDFKFFTVSRNSAVLTFTAADEYIRFATENGEILPVGTVTSGIELFEVAINPTTPLTGAEDTTSLAKGSVTKVGYAGAGTVNRIIKDLRIPTNAKTDPFEVKDGGMPVPNGKYDQYLIEVETKRRHIAGGVVGSVNETSLTSFVFFIESSALSDWKNVMERITKATGTGVSSVDLNGYTISAGTGGTMTVNGTTTTSMDLPKNANVTVAVTPTSPNTTATWTGTTGSVTTGDTRTFSVTNNVSVAFNA